MPVILANARQKLVDIDDDTHINDNVDNVNILKGRILRIEIGDDWHQPGHGCLSEDSSPKRLTIYTISI